MPSTRINNEESSSIKYEEVSSRDEVYAIGDEKAWPPTGLETTSPAKRNSFWAAIERYRWLIDAFLLFVIVGLLFLLHRHTNSRQVGGDFKGAAPELGTQILKFNSDTSFVPKNMSQFFAQETLDRWNSIMPDGTGRPPNTEDFSATSMTHQLHCLYMMAKIYSGISSNMTSSLPEDPDTHFLHCVDYIRQGIMCSGDLAVEVHDSNDPDDLGPLDGGWSGIHVCKDYSQVKSYLKREIAEGARVVLPIDD